MNFRIISVIASLITVICVSLWLYVVVSRYTHNYLHEERHSERVELMAEMVGELNDAP